jgi:hypothetical protein
VIYFVNNKQMLANIGVQIEMWKSLKTMQITTIFFLFLFFVHFLCSWDMLKGGLLISKFTLQKYLIYWLNQLYVDIKSHVFQPTIITYYHYVSHQGFENFKILLCMLLCKNAWFTLKLIINHMSWLMFSFQFSTIVSLVNIPKVI